MLVYTSCGLNYLPKARVLAQSLKKFHPDWQFCLLLADPVPEGINLEQEPFDNVITFAELGIPGYPGWAFQHNVVEICTAVKGYGLNRFLEQDGHDKVIYLDPDILVLGSLAPLEAMLDSHDILLTPHQLAPQTTQQAILDNEICSLRHGVFNLGFAAAAKRGDGIAFSRFWRDRLADWCYDDKENGLFTDQKWCDLAPAYFPALGIVRDPGYNAASWNLTDRTITKAANGEFLANGKPLRFYHFTGYDSGMGKIMSSIYGRDMPAVAELWDMYAGLLEKAGHAQLKNLAWSGSTFSNGARIPPEARLFYRENSQIQAVFPDPFLTDPASGSGFAAYWDKYARRENNRFYVWARKPFRLLNLTRLYLARNGGLKGMPRLYARVRDTWRQGGATAVLDAVRKFKHSSSANPLTLNQVLKPPSQWAATLANAFDGKKGVLLIDHMYGGGANDYRNRRIDEFLAAGEPVLLLTWDFFGKKLKCSFRLPDGSGINADGNALADLHAFPKIRFNRILVNELVLWSNPKNDRNHYQALPELIDDILALRERDDSFLEIAANDYYAICPEYNLLENGETFCGVSQDETRCSACLAKSPFPVPPDFNVSAWRTAWAKAFAKAAEIRVFSRSSADILSGVYPAIKSRLVIIPHEELGKLRVPERASGPMRIGVIGHVAKHKGADVVKELAGLLAEDESLVVLGELENNPGIQATGQYQRQDLPGLIEKEGVTICLVPSIWPETYCYVVQEVMQMDMPLVVFPIGAQAERTRDYPKGLLAASISASSALEALRELDRRTRSS